MAKLINVTKDITATAEATARLDMLTPTLRNAIVQNKVVWRDQVLYVTKNIGAQVQSELCVANDSKVLGLCNFDRRRLEANTYFLMVGMRLLAGTKDSKGADCADPSKVVYGPLSGTLLNGELEFKLGNVTIFDSLSLRKFAQHNDEDPGFYRLDNPVMIIAQTEIIPTIKLVENTATNLCIRFEMDGVITAKK